MASEFTRLRICLGKDKKSSKKIFWIANGRDGSLMTELPYVEPESIYFGKFRVPAGTTGDLNYGKIGQKTDIIPKFNYHARSGDCQFSKSGHIKRSHVISRIPLREIRKQTHIFTLYINGYPTSFDDFAEVETKKRDLKEKIFNVIFCGSKINMEPSIRHQFRFFIEPADGFDKRHKIKKDANFYPSQNGDPIFIYNLAVGKSKYKCLLVYHGVKVGDGNEHFVFFGGADPWGNQGKNDDFLFIVGNC